MAAYFRFIVYTAQGHAHIFASQGLGYAFAQRSLTHAGRAVQTHYGGFHVLTQLHNSDMLYDAFLYLFQSVMVFLQLLLDLVNVKVVLGIYIPRQVEHCFQITVLNTVFGT